MDCTDVAQMANGQIAHAHVPYRAKGPMAQSVDRRDCARGPQGPGEPRGRLEDATHGPPAPLRSRPLGACTSRPGRPAEGTNDTAVRGETVSVTMYLYHRSIYRDRSRSAIPRTAERSTSTSPRLPVPLLAPWVATRRRVARILPSRAACLLAYTRVPPAMRSLEERCYASALTTSDLQRPCTLTYFQ